MQHALDGLAMLLVNVIMLLIGGMDAHGPTDVAGPGGPFHDHG